MQSKQVYQREVNGGELSGSLSHMGREVVRYEIIYPRIKATTAVEQRINRYHQNQARSFERLIENRYLPQAREQYKLMEGHEGFRPLEIMASHQVMYNSGQVLSVFTDTYFQLWHQGSRLARSSRTYDMKTGRVLLLPQLFTRGSLFRRGVAATVKAEIEKEAEKQVGTYFSDWQQLFPRAMSDSSFYLADHGIVIYFQENVIAGRNAGLPSFLVPYGQFDGMLHFGLQ